MKIIKLTESDLKKIVERVISEQSIMGKKNDFKQQPNPSDYLGKGSGFERQNYPERFARKLSNYETCVPESLRGFIKYVMSNKNTVMKQVGVNEKVFFQMVKAAIGIIGRETKYGNYVETSDTVSEFLRSNGLGGLVNFAMNANNAGRKLVGKKEITQSLGLAQFTPETWKKYGLDQTVGPFDESFSGTKQGLATLFKLGSEYQKAIKMGLSPEVPSQNQILQTNGIISKINGTGNNALDASIVTHNMTADKLLTKYCTTNNPLYAAPCNLSTYTPFETEQSFNQNKSTKLINTAKVDPKFKKFPGNLTVNRNNVLPGYFPNLKGPNHTAIGYLEEVVGNMGKLTCF